MADERDPKVSARYRELGAEEPPRALDEAILAASRRAVDARPAPLVAPTGRGRWYFPVAAAAIITLAVAVTVQVERQRPDGEFLAHAPSPSPAAMPAESKEEVPLKAEVLKSPPKQVKPAPSAPPPGFTPDPQASAQAHGAQVPPPPYDLSRNFSGGLPVEAPVVPAPAQRPAAPAEQNANALRDLARSGPATAPPRDMRMNEQARRDATETRRMEAELQVKPPEGSGIRSSAAPPVAGAGIRGSSVNQGPVSPTATTGVRGTAGVLGHDPSTPQAAPAPAPSPSAAPPLLGIESAAVVASRLYVNPERWLELIVDLRREGKHDDADKLLAEFRRSYPDYKLSDEMRSKVEKK